MSTLPATLIRSIKGAGLEALPDYPDDLQQDLQALAGPSGIAVLLAVNFHRRRLRRRSHLH